MAQDKEKTRIHFNDDLKPEKKDNEKNGPPSAMQLKMDKDSGIFFGKGIFENQIHRVSQFAHHYMGKPQNIDGHAIVLGSTGSGKGTCIAIPTMRSWGANPMIVLDIKGELYRNWLNMPNPTGRPAKVFDPSQDNAYSYDPFSHIKNDNESNLVSNVRELVNAIIPIPIDSKDKFWTTAAQKILTGALLYSLEEGEDFYTAIDRITGCSIVELFKTIDKSENSKAKKYIRSFSGKEDLDDSEMLMDINETLDTYLMEFVNDDRIKKALTKSENSINWKKDLDTYNIFLTIPEDKIDQWGSILRMMVTQLVRTLERRREKYSPEGANLPSILLLLDEFPRIGKMDVLANALSTLRSKNVTMLLFAQSKNQLHVIYGADTSSVMLENCDFKAVLKVNDGGAQDYFSKLAGTIPSQSKHESREPLIRPEEFATLDKELILYTPYGVYRVRKVPYHEWKPDEFVVNIESPKTVRSGEFTYKGIG